MGSAAPRHVGSSGMRNQTHASCIGRQILYPWASREAPWWEEKWLAQDHPGSDCQISNPQRLLFGQMLIKLLALPFIRCKRQLSLWYPPELVSSAHLCIRNKWFSSSSPPLNDGPDETCACQDLWSRTSVIQMMTAVVADNVKTPGESNDWKGSKGFFILLFSWFPNSLLVGLLLSNN